MGKGGGSVKTEPVVAEEPVTPAVARSVQRDTDNAQANQQEQRARMRGIRSTYNRFAEQSGTNGSAKVLG